ncbi:MAG: hypothetical protein GY861_09950 [bacterium]|nr:hypothetical protein [bacterium]
MKKGVAMFSVLIVIIFTISVLASFIIISGTYKELSSERPLGANQFELFAAYQDGEETGFYIEEAADYALNEALFEFAKGDYNLGCGRYNGIAVWGEGCYPTKENLGDALAPLFNMNLDAYMWGYEVADVPTGNYRLKIDENKINAIATSPLVIKLNYPSEEDEYEFYGNKIRYSLHASFTKEANMNDYLLLADKAKIITNTCTSSGFDSCVDGFDGDAVGEMTLQTGCATAEDGYVIVCASSDNKLKMYDENSEKLVEKTVSYKFALHDLTGSP